MPAGAIAAGIAGRGPDRRDVAVAGPCVLLHAALWTTPEARQERQPQRHVARDTWIVSDGRIDNRDELRQALGSSVRQPLATDADYLLAAYERWGEACVHRLVGEYAFVIWDGERQRLVAVRDHLGLRPLFWSALHGDVVVASTIPGVVAGLERTPVRDDAFLIGFLADQPSRTRTWWNGVLRLEAGHVLVAERDGVRTHRWWNPSAEQLRHSLDETVEQVRETFDEAVGCRLRAIGPVACDISGGLDSSTVAATATQVAGSVIGVGLGYPQFPAADEVRYQQAVATHLGIPLHLVDTDNVGPRDAVDHFVRHGEPMYGGDMAYTSAAYAAVSEQGARVRLSGTGGDEALFGSYAASLDLAASGRIFSARRFAEIEGGRQPFTRWLVRTLARDQAGRLAASLAPEWLRRRRRARLEQRLGWLHSVEGVELASDRPRGMRRVPWNRLSNATYCRWDPMVHDQNGFLAAEQHVETRHPFLDRRFVELALRLPEEHVRMNGEFRALHRRAFGERLPQAVRERTDKAEFSDAWARQMMLDFERLPGERSLAALETFMDPAALLPSLANLPSLPESGSPTLWQLWAPLAIAAAMEAPDAIS